MKTGNILADHMGISRPEPVERTHIRKARGRDIIGQRIHPDIHHMFRVTGNRNAPVKGRAADREILEATFDKGHDFIAVMLRRDKFRMFLIMLEQSLGIGGETEEIALLLNPLDGRTGGGKFLALPVGGQLALIKIGFVANGIKSGIFGQINIAMGFHPLPYRLRGTLVAVLCGADIVISMGIQRLTHTRKLCSGAVGQGLRGQPFTLGRLLHFKAMLIHAGDKKCIETIQPFKTLNGIRNNPLIGMADMRRAIGIRNGCCQIKTRALRHDQVSVEN